MRYREDDFMALDWLEQGIDRTIWNEEEVQIEQLSLTSLLFNF